MKNWPEYELLDFAAGRKLERFGGLVVDRPAPAAEGGQRTDPAAWKQAAARFSGARVGEGKWKLTPAAKGEAPVLAVPLTDALSFRLQCEFSPAGQVGVFPEQFDNWAWIARQASRAAGGAPRPPENGEGGCRVLNLFGYTGASTLAAAAAGAEVTHVDASKPSVALARRNAELSGLADAPIRWIVEDVVRYCQREVKRGIRYDAVIVDPPTYGHGPKGESWKLSRDLPKLFSLIAELTEGAPRFLLATCHTPGVGPAELGAYLADGVFGSCAQGANTGLLSLVDAEGRRLESGVQARWPQ